jgi:FKBP-type peptidyl-prolyl cis-trans isomerase
MNKFFNKSIMKITNVLFGLLVLLCVACNKSEKETPNGFKFKVLKSGDGKVGKPGQILVLDFQMKDSKDSVWSDTRKDGAPIPAMIADSTQLATEPGMLQVLRMISKGDSVTFSVPLKELLAGRPPMPGMDTTLIISYNLIVHDIMERQAYEEYQMKLMADLSAKQLVKDVAAIDSFLAEKGIQAEKSESGLRYVITKPGQGENCKPGQTVQVNYYGYLLDGQCFDTNVKTLAQEKGVYNAGREPYSPYPVTIDQTQVINGWHQALKLMNKGAKATFYIPSPLAYGRQQRSEIIKANSILVFDLEVVDLK